jgi:hypothetical protein
MKRLIIISVLIIATASLFLSCTKKGLIDDNGLLITSRSQCYMSFFELLGTDNYTVLTATAIIDTTALTVTGVAKLGTNLKHVKPYCSVVTDAIVEPAMGQWVDFTSPRQYTVISGNRKVKKAYTITITVQQ